MNSWGVKTHRGKTWSNGSIHSVHSVHSANAVNALGQRQRKRGRLLALHLRRADAIQKLAFFRKESFGLSVICREMVIHLIVY